MDNEDEQLLDHQDWKKIVIKKKYKKKRTSNNNNDEKNIVKKIEVKANTDYLKHNEYTKEFRIKMVNNRTSVLNMTQKQLATKLNLTEKIIKDIESGKAIYNIQYYNKIKRLLNI